MKPSQPRSTPMLDCTGRLGNLGVSIALEEEGTLLARGATAPSTVGSVRLQRAALITVGPRVRIRLPPAASLSQRCTSRLQVQSPALWPRSAGGWGREKGRAGCEPGLLRPFSLTGIDAVPPPESSDRLQPTRGAVGPRPGAYLSGVAVQPAS